jgi:hypothetical protein
VLIGIPTSVTGWGVLSVASGSWMVFRGIDQTLTATLNIVEQKPGTPTMTQLWFTEITGSQTAGAVIPLLLDLTAGFGGGFAAARGTTALARSRWATPASASQGYTGARTLLNPNALTQAEADRLYAWVRSLDAETNIATVARYTGVPVQVVRSVRQHIFFEEHLLPSGADGTGRLVMRRFDADQGIAAWWQAATKGRIPKAELERVHAIFAHEYVERALMRSGMLYLQYPPFQYPGAHPLSPLFPNTRPGTPVYPLGVGPWDHLQRYGL